MKNRDKKVKPEKKPKTSVKDFKGPPSEYAIHMAKLKERINRPCGGQDDSMSSGQSDIS
jgi:hypothetical protein